ncbi:arylsulfatase [Xylariaceae sp. FL0016]|nr:arylsulfatase [Xylariaceae sp. FL0016]
MRVFAVGIACLLAVAKASQCSAKKPNILFIMTDDQDLRMGSTDYQAVLKSEMGAKGVEFVNHSGTMAQCCPSRTSLLRRQAAHNTNVTHVRALGGNYDKFVASGENENYLPHWMKAAGYRTEYVGKFLNGLNTANYNNSPKGWDHIDGLLDPYINSFNTVVMSQNGETPIHYAGFHQSDVIRAKALDLSPHVEEQYGLAIPLARHMNQFPNTTVPRHPNFNPADAVQAQKTGLVRQLPSLNSTGQAFADKQFQYRVAALQGVNEIIYDTLALLEAKGELDNTYVIYTSDNGYKLGTMRIPAGKATPYAEDTNLPFVVRGPGIPAGVVSKIPSTHLDLAPTFLDIARLDKSQWPVFLDGRSLLNHWQNPDGTVEGQGDGVSREIINIEFWGLVDVETPDYTYYLNSSYKSLRLTGEKENWVYIKWCTNEVELYNTAEDPYELTNLANSTDAQITRLLNRINGILLVTKSCASDSCRDPWMHLQPDNANNGTAKISTLVEAMQPQYDSLFAGLPQVSFDECLQFQSTDNEAPYYPPASISLGREHRRDTDGFLTSLDRVQGVSQNAEFQGSLAQRNVTLAQIMEQAVIMNASQIAVNATWSPATDTAVGT